MGASGARSAAMDRYLRYFGRLRQVGARLITFPTVLMEMANAIEREEYKAACFERGIQPFSNEHNLKSFRSDSKFRETVSEFVAAVWESIEEKSEVISCELNASVCSAAASLGVAEAIDINDALHLNFMSSVGVTNILSDDIDFVTVESPVTLLTRNERAISRAAEMGTLARR